VEVNTPEQSLQQCYDALSRANEVRSYRARLKKDMKAGRVDIHELFMKPPKILETMKLIDLMLSTPKFGRVKVNKILTQCSISPSKTVGGLSERQRLEICRMLRK